jgi:hypothetical protein
LTTDNLKEIEKFIKNFKKNAWQIGVSVL